MDLYAFSARLAELKIAQIHGEGHLLKFTMLHFRNLQAKFCEMLYDDTLGPVNDAHLLKKLKNSNLVDF